MINHETNIATVAAWNKRRKRQKGRFISENRAKNLAAISIPCIEFTATPHPLNAQLVCDGRIQPYLYK